MAITASGTNAAVDVITAMGGGAESVEAEPVGGAVKGVGAKAPCGWLVQLRADCGKLNQAERGSVT